ncbi:MAG: hypothetical protein VB137_07620 [Burkholderia sp.]
MKVRAARAILGLAPGLGRRPALPRPPRIFPWIARSGMSDAAFRSERILFHTGVSHKIGEVHDRAATMD